MSHFLFEDELGEYMTKESENDEDVVIDESELDFDVEENDDTYEAPDGEDAVPELGSREWHDYVMKQFDEDELQNDAPTLDGLRRVVELLIGEIVGVDVKIPQTPTTENNSRATAVVTITVQRDANSYLNFTDAADVYHGNTDAPFSKHPVATATSRAEARALRKMLRLRKVISAEEQSVAAELDDTQTGEFVPSPISAPQISLLSTLAKRHNVNLVKFINMGEKQYDKINDILFSTAQQMIEKIQTYKEETPAALKGYDPNWRATHG
jgi:hypothetical protein